jgi:molecular chaperone GrpE
MSETNKKSKLNMKKIHLPMKGDELTELKNQMLRVQADFDNYRKRTQKEKEEFGSYLNTDLILRIIPVMDNFQLALKHLPKELEGNNWAAGIFHIERQLEQILGDEGVQKIQSVGQVFDPHQHEAIEEVPSELPEHTIVEEVLAGYRLKDRVVRPSKVKVSAGNNKNLKEELNEGDQNE